MDGTKTEGRAMIETSDTGALRIAALSRPEKANALDPQTVAELSAFVAGATAEARPFALTGGERVFCGGFDLTGFEQESEGDLLLRFARIEILLQAISAAPAASFALVAGTAMGAGADLAAACTYRLGTRRARFRFPGFRFGVALGTRRLAGIVGADRARAILLENRTVDAEQALEIGLLTHIVDAGDLLPAANRILAAHGGLSSSATERILRLTSIDTRAADLADLVRSLCAEGLHERIANYRGGHADSRQAEGNS